jgi:hypothetical protein
MYSSAPPEILIFAGVIVFLVMSFTLSIFEKQFPKPLQYLFQIAALAGFGQIWANYKHSIPRTKAKAFMLTDTLEK